jgi:hypothetical protein
LDSRRLHAACTPVPGGGIPSPDPALRKNPNEIQHFAITGVLAAVRREYQLSSWTMLEISRAVAHLRLRLLGEEENSTRGNSLNWASLFHDFKGQRQRQSTRDDRRAKVTERPSTRCWFLWDSSPEHTCTILRLGEASKQSFLPQVRLALS